MVSALDASMIGKWRAMYTPNSSVFQDILSAMQSDPYVLAHFLEGSVTRDSLDLILQAALRGMEYAVHMWGDEAVPDEMRFDSCIVRKDIAFPFKISTQAHLCPLLERPDVWVFCGYACFARFMKAVRNGAYYWNDHIPDHKVSAIDGMTLVFVEECRHAYRLHTQTGFGSLSLGGISLCPVPRDHPLETEMHAIIAQAIRDLGIQRFKRSE